jgi:hypothetical protein
MRPNKIATALTIFMTAGFCAAANAETNVDFDSIPFPGVYAVSSVDYSTWKIYPFQIPTRSVDIKVTCRGALPEIGMRRDGEDRYVAWVHCDGAKVGEQQ